MFRILKWLILSVVLFLVVVVMLIASSFKIIQGVNVKDSVLDTYQTVIQKIGEKTLTSSTALKGKRTFGKDYYVGTYTVTYQKNTGTEKIFGGCTLEREAGSTIHVTVSVENSSGEIAVVMKEKEKDRVLATEDGTYSYDFNVQYGSNYLIIQTRDYSGNVKIESK